MVYIFNSKKEFWNASTREFQETPYVIKTSTEALMEIRLAARKDSTSDLVHFDEQFQRNALEHIQNLNMSKDRLKAIKDMNGCLR